MIKKMLMQPLMFDGDGGAVGADAAQGNEGAAASGQDAHAQVERKSFDELLEDEEYRKEYDQRVRKVVTSRFGDYGALKKTAEEMEHLRGLMHAAYPADIAENASNEDIIRALENRNQIWEEAAARAGMDTESYKQFMKMQRENEMFKRQAKEAEDRAKMEARFRAWDAQVPEVQALYPGFSLEAEAANPRFVGLLDQGWSMLQAFEAIHHREIQEGAIAMHVEAATKKQAQAIMAGKGRPVEGAAAQGAATAQKNDLSNMSDDDFEKLKQRVLDGERLSF